MPTTSVPPYFDWACARAAAAREPGENQLATGGHDVVEGGDDLHLELFERGTEESGDWTSKNMS